jgi:hypothetical protein
MMGRAVSVLGQVIVDAQRVLTVVKEVLGHGAAGVGSHELDRRGLVGGRRHDDGLLHGTVLDQRLGQLNHCGHALSDGDVYADQIGVPVVDDGVDRDRGLAGLAVADDQLALATADRDHRVDGLQPGLHRLLHRLALNHPGSLEFGHARVGGVDIALAVQGAAQGIHDPPEQGLPHRDLEQVSGALDRVALDDVLPRSEQHDAHVVGLEVQGQPGHVVGELEQLEGLAVLDPVDPGDAVGNRQHGPHLGELRLPGIQALDSAPEDAGDFVGVDLHLVSGSPSGRSIGLAPGHLPA